MLYSSFIPSLANNSAQNLLKKLGSRSVISFPGRPQSIKSKRLKIACAHYSANQVSAPLIRVTHFENLHITDMIVLKPCFISERASTKSSVRVKKGAGGDSIS